MHELQMVSEAEEQGVASYCSELQVEHKPHTVSWSPTHAVAIVRPYGQGVQAGGQDHHKQLATGCGVHEHLVP